MTAGGPRMTAGDAWTGLVIRLADDDLLTGHVLTSVAGWGPELEINIALSSMGQDEIGHARRLYALVIPDRADIERFVYERPAADFRAGPLARTYPREWEALLARQYLGETADAARAAVLGHSTRPGFAALLDEMGHEQRYHLDFWSAWLTTSARSGEARQRVQHALDQMWPLAAASFLPDDPAGTESTLGLGSGTLEAARRDWIASVRQACGPLGLEVRDGDGPADVGPADVGPAGDGPAADRLAVMLGEMRYVYATAPGSW